MTPAESDLMATAYHQAAHAVVAWSQGIRITSASIVPTKRSDGHATLKHLLARSQLDSSTSDAERLKAERHVRVDMAG
jgi:ATP-dependent Zn protease